MSVPIKSFEKEGHAYSLHPLSRLVICIEQPLTNIRLEEDAGIEVMLRPKVGNQNTSVGNISRLTQERTAR